MEMLNFIFDAASVAPGDFTGFTFFIGSVSMLAATVWFLMQHGQVDKKFKDSMLVAALITGIAAVHYFYMREQWVLTGTSPTELRYIDWILTVPLMVVEFALLTGVGMRKLFWLSVGMLVTGYFGEAVYTTGSGPAVWGLVSGLAYFYIAYEIWLGGAAKLAAAAGGAVQSAHSALCWGVIEGWAIDPNGDRAGSEGWRVDPTT